MKLFDGTIKRGTFLKTIAAALGGFGASRFLSHRVTGEGADEPRYNDKWEPGEYRWLSGTCVLCPSLCGFEARQVELGERVCKLEGEKSHPVNSGALCAIGQASLQHLYNPERIKYSQRFDGTRIDPKDLLASVKKIIDKRGLKPIIISKEPPGTLKDLIHVLRDEWNADHYDLFAGDKPTLLSDIIGSPIEPYIPFSKNKYLLYFEGSILEESHYSMSVLSEYGEMKGAGHKAKITVFTSRENITSSKGDEVHFIRPGAVYAVALGILNLLTRKYKNGKIPVRGLDQVVAKSREYSTKTVRSMTGIREDILESVAGELRRAKPALAISEWNIPRNPAEKALLTAVMAINAVLGNVKKKSSLTPRSPVRSIWNARKTVSNDIEKLESLLLKAKGPTFILHISGDPVFEMKNFKKMQRLIRDVPMISFFPYNNCTNRNAEARINTTTHFEESQILVSNSLPGQVIYSWTQPLVPKVKERFSRIDILLSLIKNKAHADDEEDWFNKSLQRLSRLTNKGAKEIKEAFVKVGFVKAATPLASIKLALDVREIDTLEKNTPPRKTLLLYPFKSMAIRDGDYNHIPWLRDIGGIYMYEHWRLFVEINPKTLKYNNLTNGQEVLVFRKGSKGKPVVARIRSNPVVSIDTIALPVGFGKKTGGLISHAKRDENLYGLASAKEMASKWIEVGIKKI